MGIKHRASFFADDVALFVRSHPADLRGTRELLHIFAGAYGLQVNMSKSAIVPIRCHVVDLQAITAEFPCATAEFPIKYLGLPLSPTKLLKADLTPLVDSLANQLPVWKTNLIPTCGRIALLNSMLIALGIYNMLALDMPPWLLKVVDKIRQGFL